MKTTICSFFFIVNEIVDCFNFIDFYRFLEDGGNVECLEFFRN